MNLSGPLSAITDQLADLIERVSRQETRVVVEHDGIPVAAIVSVSDLQHLHQLDRARAEREAALDAMRAPFRDVPSEEIERETDRILARVRAEMRAEREQEAAGSR